MHDQDDDEDGAEEVQATIATNGVNVEDLLPLLRRQEQRSLQKKKFPRRRGSSFLVYKTFDEDNIMNHHTSGGGREEQQRTHQQPAAVVNDGDINGVYADEGDSDYCQQQHKQKHDAAIVVILLGFLTAVGVGCIVGIVPQIATRRYAALMTKAAETEDAIITTTSVIDNLTMTKMGAERAQSVASMAAFGRYSLALFTNAFLGSWSDMYGRKPVQILGLTLLTLSPLTLIAVQILPLMSPTWYFAIASLESIVHFLSIGFIQLTDVIDEPKHRSTAYGLYFGSFMGGIALAPFLATIMSHLAVTITSFIIRLSSLLIAICYLPETLSETNRRKETNRRQNELAEVDNNKDIENKDITIERPKWTISLCRSFREMSILRRTTPLMLISTAAFLSKAVFSADVTLFFFYGERELGVHDNDVAAMMFVTGCFGVLMQAVLLKYMVSFFGEHSLLQLSFASGAVHNLIYGLSRNKWQLYAGLCLSQLTNTNSPLLSSLASRSDGVNNTELGRIQGALFSLTSLAEAVGPLSFNFVFRHWTVPWLGSGTMFGFGSILYALGLVAISFTLRKPHGASKEPNEPEDFDDFEDCKYLQKEETRLLS
jgi:MFS family permease